DRLPRPARDRRAGRAHDPPRARARRRLPAPTVAGAERRRALLALRRRGLDRGVHRRLREGPNMKWDPLALAACLVALVVFPKNLWLIGALAAFLVALVSPVATLADGGLFSAHMVQHLLPVPVVPPPVLLAVGPSAGARRVPPLLGWALGVGAMWLWHARSLCDAAATSTLVQRVQEGSLLLMGTAFWWPILRRPIAPLAGAVYLFGACVACTILGIAIALSPVQVCPAFPCSPNDQQLGGLIMWVPGCIVYLV